MYPCFRFAWVAALLGAAVRLPAATPLPDDGVPAELRAHLTNGVNITRWFGYVSNPDDLERYKTYFSDADFDNLKRLGVRFVRLCITPKVIYADGQPKPAALNAIDQALDRFQAADVAVIFDFHDNGEMKLDDPGKDNAGFISFWEAIARHYKGRRENSLIFELVNEPIFRKNPEVWEALQQKTVAAIRAIDPARTLMVSGPDYSNVDALLKLKPLPEKNLLYTYHCYDPFLFTHQGATWSSDNVKPLKNIPFPSSPEAVAKILDDLPEASRAEIRRYGEKRYDEDYLRAQLKKGVDWARDNKVTVVLGEFGVNPPVAPPDSRGRWFAVMHKLLAELELPHAIWGYDDGLGLGRRRMADGTVWLDPVTLRNFYPAYSVPQTSAPAPTPAK